MKEPAGVIQCVLDVHPRFYLEALRWYASATEIAGIDPHDLRVKIVGQPRADVADFLRERGVCVQAVEEFDTRSLGYTNKISGALRLCRERFDGVAVLGDADLLICEDPRSIALPADSVGMNPVDHERPSMAVLRSVFAAAKLPEPPPVDLPLLPGAQTLTGNGNGGLYVVPAGILPALAQAWARWARWLLDRPELLGLWASHVDQVGMALAVASEGIGVVRLGTRWNAPIHFPELADAQTEPPAIIHYHQRLDEFAQVKGVGIGFVDTVVDRANAASAKVWQQSFPSETFWNWRYVTDPELGPGEASRGRALYRKRQLLKMVLRAVEPASVLDVGCGDGRVTRRLDMAGYTGLDLAAAAVKRAREDRPDRTFVVGDPVEMNVEADLVVCLDVLTHQADARYYGRLVESLLACARRGLLVSGYEREPVGPRPPIDFFHEALSVTLARLGTNIEVRHMWDDKDVATVLVSRAPLVDDLAGYGRDSLSVWALAAGDALGRLGGRIRVAASAGAAGRLWQRLRRPAGVMRSGSRPSPRLPEGPPPP